MDESITNPIIQNYLNHCKFEKGLDAKTLKAYRIDLTQFDTFVTETGGKYDKESIQAYTASLHGKYAVKSVKRKIASLKAFFCYLEFEDQIPFNPFSKLRIKLHEPYLLPRTIALSTVSTLLQCAYQQLTDVNKSSYQYNANLRDIAVLELLFATGIRISELCALRPDDVNLIEGTVKIYGKGSKERLIQISNQDVLIAVNNYYRAFSENIESTGCFFVNRLTHQLSDQSVRLMINKYCNIAGISQHITPHMFRHSFATLLLEEDVDIRYIQQLLGHSSIVTTQIYTHVTSKKQRDILSAKHPRNKICAK